MMAEIKEIDFEDELTTSDVMRNPEAAAEKFEDIALRAIGTSSMVSCIYASGRGFDNNFADQVLVKLASGRKVYKGQNLYAKGAGYIAKTLGDGEAPQVILLDPGMVPVSLRLKVYTDGKEQEIELVSPMTPYEKACISKDLILDGADRLEFRTIDVRTDVKSKFDLSLEGLPLREPKMTRIRLSLNFTGAYSCRIDAKDMGFGSYVVPIESDDGIRHEWQTVINI